MTKDQNLDETDPEENFVIADEYDPIQRGIKQTNFSYSFSQKSRASTHSQNPSSIVTPILDLVCGQVNEVGILLYNPVVCLEDKPGV
jgi:hypothetical protein